MSARWSHLTAPDCEEMQELARDALAALPAPYGAAAQTVALRVVDLADEALLREMEIADPYALTGLYDGVPLTEKSVMDQPDRPDAIWLYRLAILDEWAERGDVTLLELVAHVAVHELAHHFGWSDDDIARIDRWWE